MLKLGKYGRMCVHSADIVMWIEEPCAFINHVIIDHCVPLFTFHNHFTSNVHCVVHVEMHTVIICTHLLRTCT